MTVSKSCSRGVSLGALTAVVTLTGLTSGAAAQKDFLPDIITRESDLYDHDISTSIVPGRRHLRLSNGTANVGEGKLHLYGGPDNGDGTQQVMQRIFGSDGAHRDVLAGNFVYHPGHNHIHFEGWATYRLREVLPGDGVGAIVAEGTKTSFCIIDLGVHDSSLPGFPAGGEFNSCGSTTQGLSIGWVDVYSKGLPDQNIDITDVPEGEYWLESEANPDQLATESDYSNNISRIKIFLNDDGGVGEPSDPDSYEPNDTINSVTSRPEGGPNSPNLGPCDPSKTVEDLTIDSSGDVDRFRFYMPGEGASGDSVRIDFNHGQGDLDMRLLNASGSALATSQGTSNLESISMNGRPAGWYFVEAYGYNGATGNYTLMINPSANGAPAITPVEPAMDVSVVYSVDAYTTTWTYNDPEANEAWVTVYASEDQDLANSVEIPTSQHTPADQSLFVINTAYLEEDKTYFLYHEITDGGTTTGAWASGRLTMQAQACSPADITTDGTTNGLPDGSVTLSDFSTYLNWWAATDPRADVTTNGVCQPGTGEGSVSLSDFSCFLALWSQGCP